MRYPPTPNPDPNPNPNPNLNPNPNPNPNPNQVREIREAKGIYHPPVAAVTVAYPKDSFKVTNPNPDPNPSP